MEHFWSPDETNIIDVPIVTTEDYDGQDFMTYPARKNWSDAELNGAFGEKKPQDVEAFFQTWLYFGTLISIFRMVGIQVKTEDFIRTSASGEKFVTTAAFPDFVQTWMNKEGLRGDVDKAFAPNYIPRLVKAGRQTRSQNIETILRRVLHFVNLYCNVGGQQKAISEGTQPPFWPISPKVAMSIMAIGMPMMHVATEVYGYARYAEPKWGSGQFLNERLKDAGWCKKDIPMLGQSNSIDADYYFSSVPSPRAHLDHKDCTKVACVANPINPATYVTKHDVNCDGKCGDISAPKEIEAIVKKGGIPIVRFNPTNNELTCIEHIPQKTRYVAISHVWSDGMGNVTHNALPKCQLTRIQRIVSELYTKSHITVARRYHESYYKEEISSDGTMEWWDGEDWKTALPPLPIEEVEVGFWMDSLCVPLQYELRKLAIKQMRHVYEMSHRVIVIDSTILPISIQADTYVRAAALYHSNWRRRLWTLQEGVLGKSIMFQFRDGAQSAHELEEEHRQRHSVKDFYSRTFSSCMTPISAALEIFVMLTGADVNMRDPTLIFAPFAADVCSRATTKAEDESVCFATLLQIDVGQILDTHESKRMEKFHDLVGSYQPQIIFNDFPKLRSRGYQWAPSTFLTQEGDLFPSDHVREWERKHKPPPAVVSPHQGLLVTLPGVTLDSKFAGPHLGDHFYTASKGSTATVWHSVRFQPEKEASTFVWDSKKSYYIISAERFVEKSPMKFFALLGSSESDGKGRIELQPLARLIVTLPDPSLTSELKTTWKAYLKGPEKDKKTTLGPYPIVGKRLSPEQEWCIL